jgi:hypothetical protein
MTVRTTTMPALDTDSLDTDALDTAAHTTPSRVRPPSTVRRPALYLAVAAAGAVLVNVLTAGEPPARAETQLESVSIAQQLGISAEASTAATGDQAARPLELLAASRSEREARRSAAAQAQAAADKAELDRRTALVASRTALAAARAEAAKAAAQAAADKAELDRRTALVASRKALAAARAEAAKAAQQAQQARTAKAKKPAPAAAAAGGSFQDYAMSKLGGDGGQFSCLENLWGKESGWNPNAQNPSSTAYGIPQFLNSTWAGTGIAKTSNGYRQIDAGLIYIDSRYGSPCGAWSHSQNTGWY